MSNTDPKKIKDEEMFAQLKAEMKLFLARTAEGGAAAGVAAIGDYESELDKETRKDITSKLLDERDGNKDWLINDLLSHIEKDTKGQRATAQRQQTLTKPAGRPARRLGPDGAAIPSIVRGGPVWLDTNLTSLSGALRMVGYPRRRSPPHVQGKSVRRGG